MQNILAYYPTYIQGFKTINHSEVLLQGSWISISDVYYVEIQLITVSFQKSEKIKYVHRDASTTSADSKTETWMFSLDPSYIMKECHIIFTIFIQYS